MLWHDRNDVKTMVQRLSTKNQKLSSMVYQLTTINYLNSNPFCQSEQKSMVMATEK